MLEGGGVEVRKEKCSTFKWRKICHKIADFHCLFFFFQDELNGIERLTEDAIVTGSYKNKTLCADPEDTCDFNRAAHLASTPFHGVGAQRVLAPAFSQNELKRDSPESKSAPLNQETLVCEGAYPEALSVKKLR